MRERHSFPYRSLTQEERKNLFDVRGGRRVKHDTPPAAGSVCHVAVGENAIQRDTLPAHTLKNVSQPLACLVALMLRKRQLHVQHQPPVRRGRVEILLRARPFNPVRVQKLLHLVKVLDIAKPTIQALDDDNVDLARLHIAEKPLQGVTA